MAIFIIRRLILMAATMLFVSIAVFAITESSPGNLARNVLGAYITDEQEAAFLAQRGLDQPAYTRYLRWLIGSDWQAEKKSGFQLHRIYLDSGFYEWWAKDGDGTLLQWRMEGDALIRIKRNPDGSVEESPATGSWKKDSKGTEYFWGVNTKNSVVRWERGADSKTWTMTSGGEWLETSGAPVAYIPLKKGLLRGDPGVSLRTGRPVIKSLLTRTKNSMILAGIAFVIVMPLALFLGFVAGLYEGKFRDRLLSIGGMIFSVTPEFATGIFLILILGVWLQWVPGAAVIGSDSPLSKPEMLVLPVLTLTLIELGYILRITRASVVETMRSAFIRTAHLKGLPFWVVVAKHAARNALLAPITVIMLHVNWLLGGIVIVEVVFGYPGMGQYLLDSALYKDINALEAGAMILVTVAVGTQLLADILYTFLNPRIRYTN
ncbi:MAG: ABC transporter permease [Desulfobacterales bacterium]|nr:ABC transporter permease [Desulfobacterales bacterium]